MEVVSGDGGTPKAVRCGDGSMDRKEEQTRWKNRQEGRMDRVEEQTRWNEGRWIEAVKRKQSAREGGEEVKK